MLGLTACLVQSALLPAFPFISSCYSNSHFLYLLVDFLCRRFLPSMILEALWWLIITLFSCQQIIPQGQTFFRESFLSFPSPIIASNFLFSHIYGRDRFAWNVICYLLERGQRKTWLFWAYLCLFWGSSDSCECRVHVLLYVIWNFDILFFHRQKSQNSVRVRNTEKASLYIIIILCIRNWISCRKNLRISRKTRK